MEAGFIPIPTFEYQIIDTEQDCVEDAIVEGKPAIVRGGVESVPTLELEATLREATAVGWTIGHVLADGRIVMQRPTGVQLLQFQAAPSAIARVGGILPPR